MDAWVTGWQTGAGIPFSPKLERAKEVPGVKVPRVTAPNQKVSSQKAAIARVPRAKVPIVELNT
jgi:hypothetical protein